MIRQLRWITLLVTLAAFGWSFAPVTAGEKKIRVVIIDGQNNHNWKLGTPELKNALESTGRFHVDVSTAPLKAGDKTPQGWVSVPFPPDLAKCDVVVSNYNGAPWPADFNKAFEQAVRTGKIGLVIVHAANNTFSGWEEYRRMVGMGWYKKDSGKRLKLDDAGKSIIVPAGEDLEPGHRYTGPFKVTLRDLSHPVTRGMPSEWMHDRDELYDNMRGPVENVHVLATAINPKGKKGTDVHEPMIWTVTYGKGRVFHTPMGHNMKEDVTALRCVGFITTLQRGTEWAATGQVTLPIPSNFPTSDKISSLTPNKK